MISDDISMTEPDTIAIRLALFPLTSMNDSPPHYDLLTECFT